MLLPSNANLDVDRNLRRSNCPPSLNRSLFPSIDGSTVTAPLSDTAPRPDVKVPLPATLANLYPADFLHNQAGSGLLNKMPWYHKTGTMLGVSMLILPADIQKSLRKLPVLAIQAILVAVKLQWCFH